MCLRTGLIIYILTYLEGVAASRTLAASRITSAECPLAQLLSKNVLIYLGMVSFAEMRGLSSSVVGRGARGRFENLVARARLLVGKVLASGGIRSHHFIKTEFWNQKYVVVCSYQKF
jgi:hypothetical protein